MKKIIFTLMLAVLGVCSASAQFEKGKKYLGATTNSGNLSYSKHDKLSLGLGVNGGYMIEEALMLIGEGGLNYSNKDMQEFYVGAKCRYLIKQNGVFLQAGAKYVHYATSLNDLQLTPEVGYCFFLNRHLTIEPSLYYDISLTKYSDLSKFGLRFGLAWYF